MEIERYTFDRRDEWDAFVDASRNGTFLFKRAYLEYHRDRFTDHSLLFRRRRGGPLLALLPANRASALLESHGGLTYGGVVCDAGMTTATMLDLFMVLADQLRREGITTLRYRAVPHIYHRGPTEDDLYALHRMGARLVQRTPLSAIDRRAPLPRQARRDRGCRKARAAGVECRESHDLAAYWDLVSEVLSATYDARPVHTLEEISALATAFPEEIRLFAAFATGQMIAGVLVYQTPTVVRTQYIAAGPEGRRCAALDLLFHHLLEEVFTDERYVDFGSSEGTGAGGLNAGVIEFKESLGARTIVLDSYELGLADVRG